MTFSNPSYWLCTTPRSGSSVLGDALTHTEVAGRPTEYFNRRFWPDLFARFGVAAATDYLERVVAETATPNGVFGTKVMLDADMAPTFDALRERLGEPRLSDAEAATQAFPDLRFVYLTRRDKVAQAVSYCRAQQSGVWRRYHGSEPEPEGDAAFDYGAVHAQVQALTLREVRWQTFFNDLSARPHTAVYEDLVLEPEHTIRKILTFLELEPPPGWTLSRLPMERLADDTSKRWAELYLEEQPVRF